VLVRCGVDRNRNWVFWSNIGKRVTADRKADWLEGQRYRFGRPCKGARFLAGKSIREKPTQHNRKNQHGKGENEAASSAAPFSGVCIVLGKETARQLPVGGDIVATKRHKS